MSEITLGPTGAFPRGKLNAEDEGELCLSVSHDQGKVFIRFGTPVEWLGMDPQGAADIAAAIIEHAGAAASELDTVVTLDLGTPPVMGAP